MSTMDYLDGLTIDQLRFARDEADKRIKKAELQPNKIVWVVDNGWYNVSWHREEDWAGALKSLKKCLDEDRVTDSMERMIIERHSTRLLNLPKITPYYNNLTEYEEWFK